jgi:tetratricopeptide (TPR) repeat protein
MPRRFAKASDSSLSSRARFLVNNGAASSRATDLMTRHDGGVVARSSGLGSNVSRSNGISLHQAAIQAARAGNHAFALNLINQACLGSSIPGDCHRLQAWLQWRCGNADSAIRTARIIVRQHSRDARSWDLLGALLTERREFSESRSCYETALSLDPSLLETMHNLATVLQRLGEVEEAEIRYREVLKRAPDYLEAHLNLACLLNEVGRYKEALASVACVVARDPKMAKAYGVAAAIEFKARRYPSALEWIEQAILLRPDVIQLLTRRADILSKLGRNELALADCEKVLCHRPADSETFRVKAAILQDIDQPEEALATLQRAEVANPNNTTLTIDRAWLLAEMRRKQEALDLLDNMISAQPQLVPALDCRSFLGRYEPSHPHMGIMEAIVGKPETPAGDRMRLSFPIGRTYLDAGDGEKAFHYLNLGNRLKRQTVNYDRAVEEEWFSSIMSVFSTDLMPRLAKSDVHSSRPIFVFGMPRSGTTLVEHILASHPSVRGSGESSHLDTLVRSAVFSPGSPGLTRDNLASCAGQYLTLVGSRVPDTLHFVDKTNSNFLYAGLISIMLPGARMIHCRRDPIDTCLSCYSLNFAHGHEFAYDLAELGHYYTLYRKLMAHWNDLLPAETFLEVDYETLVNDTEGQVAKMLEFCHLPWAESCMRFYETSRVVSTSSLSQVRSPIYKSSVGRAEIFRPWLDPLIEALPNGRALCDRQ